jgi:hypothetical protein
MTRSKKERSKKEQECNTDTYCLFAQLMVQSTRSEIAAGLDRHVGTRHTGTWVLRIQAFDFDSSLFLPSFLLLSGRSLPDTTIHHGSDLYQEDTACRYQLLPSCSATPHEMVWSS